MSDLNDLLQCLVECSEKAAKIAQVFRDENDLFDLLVQEKTESESNRRFVQDFKTLADVLVQETIKRDVGQKFPELVSQIRGEEQNSFKNAQEESVDVVLTDSMENTINLLNKVLDGRKNVAQVVADIVHSTNIVCDKQCLEAHSYPVDKLGVWIDPIDSTAEFIEGKYDESAECEMQSHGLKCVCVLIGVYDLDSHSPILGVVNQPFYSRDPETGRWESKYYWGMNLGTDGETSANVPPGLATNSTTFEDFNSKGCMMTPANNISSEKTVIVISSTENEKLQEIMKRQYKLINAAGAGYKALLVAIQEADLYILSKNTTYFWDTCGPHSILKATGGGMLRLKEAVNSSDILNLEFLQEKQIKYEADHSKSGTEAFQNHEGIIAYRDPHVALKFLCFLKCNDYVAR